jgi:hypothetical protein
MVKPLLHYSTNTWLAYTIAENYYQGEHYVWCTPFFSPRSAPGYTNVPPTSCPSSIYHSLREEVATGDRHSTKIRENRTGIIKGANVKKGAGIIDDVQEREIIDVVNSAETRDFRPLLYVIPHDLVAGVLQSVPVANKAHPLSVEYVIERLPRASFDVIDFEK